MDRELNIDTLDFGKGGGLLPAIVQDAVDGRVLMLGYMNTEALERTLESGRVTFYSRTKGRLWTKGEESGNVLELVSVRADCDRDALLVLAHPAGPVCHTGSATCFGSERIPATGFLARLASRIEERAAADPRSSYTAYLLGQGLERCARKVGEEGVETALAAVSGDREHFVDEAADLVYHLLVCLHATDTSLDEVVGRLEQRNRQSADPG